MADKVERTRIMSRKRGRDLEDQEGAETTLDAGAEPADDEGTNPRARVARRSPRGSTKRLRRRRRKEGTDCYERRRRRLAELDEGGPDESGSDDEAPDEFEDDGFEAGTDDGIADEYDDGFAGDESDVDESVDDYDYADDEGDPDSTRALGSLRERISSVGDSAVLEELQDRIPLPPIVGWALSAVLAVALALVLVFSSGGFSEDDLVAYYDHIDAKEFIDAQSLLDDAGLQPKVDKALRGHLKRARIGATKDSRRKANRAYKAKNWLQALEGARKVAAVDPDADMRFIIAESLRELNNGDQGDAYQEFMNEHRDDPRIDDAYFWRAEFMANRGNNSEALELYKKVAALPKSNFKRSAQKRIKDLQ